jgi:transposase
MKKDTPVVGVDVAKDFSYYAVLSPEGKIFLKSFKALNTRKGLESVLTQIKKVEKQFGSKPAFVLESTGHYSNRIVHFFLENDLKVYIINPLLSHSIKNSTVRKVKTDKMDAEEIARIFFYIDLMEYQRMDRNFENLKILTRTYHQFSQQKTASINQLTAVIDQVMPGFSQVFKSIACKTALELLLHYPSPVSIVSASKKEVLELIKTTSRGSAEYTSKKYDLLVESAREGIATGILLEAFEQIIMAHVRHLKSINEQLDALDKTINALGINIPEVQLLQSIPAIGSKLAPIIAAEIGNIERFKSSKQLVAYCGIDPSVKQSGKFLGTKNKFTKRGSIYIRKALYMAAAVAIRKNPNGSYTNKIIYDYYQKKIQSKAKKQALGAVMNKLARIIFSVLKNQHPYVVITPEEQVKMYQQNMKIVA